MGGCFLGYGIPFSDCGHALCIIDTRASHADLTDTYAAIHFYQDNTRVPKQVEALEKGDVDSFLQMVKERVRSSWMYLQNVLPFKQIENWMISIQA